MDNTMVILSFVAILAVSIVISIIYFSLNYTFDKEVGETVPKKELKRRTELRAQNDKNQLKVDLQMKILWNLEKAVYRNQDSAKLLGQYRDLIYQTRRLTTLISQSDEIKNTKEVAANIKALEIHLYSMAINEIEQSISIKCNDLTKAKEYIEEAKRSLNKLVEIIPLKIST